MPPQEPPKLSYHLTRGWREKDAYGGLRDYGETIPFETLAEAQHRRQQLLSWRWADDEFKVEPWVGPIIRRESRGSGVKSEEIGRTIRRDDPPAPRRAQQTVALAYRPAPAPIASKSASHALPGPQEEPS